jgi:hypothetical protein
MVSGDPKFIEDFIIKKKVPGNEIAAIIGANPGEGGISASR